MSYETPTKCDRCGRSLYRLGHITSMFNLDVICIDCKRDEAQAPNYAAARRAEALSVERGERNFPGIGLAPEDEAFLAERRALRKLEEEARTNGRR